MEMKRWRNLKPRILAFVQRDGPRSGSVNQSGSQLTLRAEQNHSYMIKQTLSIYVNGRFALVWHTRSAGALVFVTCEKWLAMNGGCRNETGGLSRCIQLLYLV